MPTETSLERWLRDDLRARQAAVPPAPVDLADRVRRRSRSQRRAQLLTAAAAVAVVAVVAGGASLIPRGDGAGRSDVAAGPSAVTGTLLDWPTRGSLADDEAWVDGVRRLDWEVPMSPPGEQPEPSVLDRRVLFAGDIPGGRAALVVGEDGDTLLTTWFTGPEGAAPEAMAPVGFAAEALPNEAQALVRAETPLAREAQLVVVTYPGWSVTVSRPPVVDAQGRETSEVVELPVENGIVVADLDHGFGLGTLLETGRDGTMSAPVYPAFDPQEEPGPVPPPPPGSTPSDDEALVDEAVDQLMLTYDLDPAQARPTVLTIGSTPAGQRVFLVGLTFPSGATGVWLYTGEGLPEGGWSYSLGHLPHAPAGTALEDRLVAVPADGYHLAMAAPAGSVRAEVLDSDGDVLGTVELSDGGYVGEVPGGAFAPSTDGAATVRALDASGAVLAEAPIGRLVTG